MTANNSTAWSNALRKRVGSRPLALRIRIALLLILGIAGFSFWFLLVLIAAGLFLLSGAAVNSALGVWLLLLGSLLMLLGVVQAAGLMLVDIQPLQGRRLDLCEALRLQAILARLSKSLGTARFDQVLITTEFNAGVVLLPRLGVLGLSRRVLRLGLPMLGNAFPLKRLKPCWPMNSPTFPPPAWPLRHVDLLAAPDVGADVSATATARPLVAAPRRKRAS